MNNESSFKRDFFLLALLLFMGKMALNLRHDDPVFQMIGKRPSASFNMSLDTKNMAIETAQSSELPEHLQPEEPQSTECEPFQFHLVDKNILKQIDCTIAHIKQTLEVSDPASYHTMQLLSFKNKLKRMRQSYQHTSPGVVCLGPFATEAIILKEQRIQNELLAIANRVGVILHELAHHHFEYQRTDTIMGALEANHYVLNKIKPA